MGRLRFGVVLVCLAHAGVALAGLTPTKASQLVSLRATGSCPILGYANATTLDHLARSDGSGGPLVIPPKQVLVLNDIVASTSGQAAGNVFGIQVVVGSTAQSQIVAEQFESTSSSGVMVVRFTPPSGIAVKSGSAVCVYFVNLSNPSAIIGIFSTAHGFFAPDK
jgi:hypothetical protein